MAGKSSRFADFPSGLSNGAVESDPNANYFRKDSSIPTSFVISTTSFVEKSNFKHTKIGAESESNKKYYAFEESLTDIGGGVFKVTTKYAAVPETWYSYESINIPYLKFSGLSVVGGGKITINTTYLFNFLNVQSIADVNFFNEDGYTSFEEKSGTINVACRVKHEYVLLKPEDIKSGNIDMAFDVSIDSISFGDGKYNCGYMMRDGDPQVNENIDKESTFNFATSSPSPKVRIASGIYAGVIYYKHTYEIIDDVTI